MAVAVASDAFTTALQHFRADCLADAEHSCRTLLASTPDHADCLHLLGIISQRSGDLEAALDLIGRALALRPGNTVARHNLYWCQIAFGSEQFRNGRPEQAALTFQQAVTLLPELAEGHLNLGAALESLGDLEQARSAYRQGLTLDPKQAAGWVNLHSVILTSDQPEPAAQCLERALALDPQQPQARLLLGVLRAWQGDDLAAERHFQQLQGHPLGDFGLDSWRYIQSTCRDGLRPRLFGSTAEGLQLGLAAATNPGLVLEFGVRFGTSLRQIAARAGQTVHGFDSFTGLPEDWLQLPRGSYSTGGVLPDLPLSVQLHQGLFEHSLPGFLARHDGPIRFVNVDCDLYRSAATVLQACAPRIVPGSVLVFDEYLGHATWRNDEFLAFQEAAQTWGWHYQYLGFSLFSKQAVIRITGVA